MNIQLPKIRKNIENIYNTLLFTIDNFKKYLESANDSKLVEEYSILKVYQLYLQKSKLIFSALNKLKEDNRIFFGLFWVPSKYSAKVEEKIREGPRTRVA